MNERIEGQSGKFIVGVTGNIATGKSAVMRLAAEEGALTIDADKLVHELMDNDPELQAEVTERFGSEIRRQDGRINRRKLGELVFNDPTVMRKLEEVVHPAVYEEIGRRLVESARPLVFVEAIKLLEGKLADACQQIWVTRCSRQNQLQRLRICRGMDTQSAAARIKAQPPQEEKVALADFVIETDGYMRDTEVQFRMAWDRLPDSVKTVPRPPAPSRVKPKVTDRRSEKAAVREPAERQREPVEAATDETVGVAETEMKKERLADVDIRRARPSDIPSILLLIQKATDGALKMKRAELLMAFSERSYFIGQVGTDVSAIMGWNIDSQIARIDQVFIYPLAAASETGLAIIEEVEKSAKAHICEVVVVFLNDEVADEVRQLFVSQGYGMMEKGSLPRAWRKAIDESIPEDAFFMIKVLREERLRKAQA